MHCEHKHARLSINHEIPTIVTKQIYIIIIIATRNNVRPNFTQNPVRTQGIIIALGYEWVTLLTRIRVDRKPLRCFIISDTNKLDGGAISVE